MQFKQRGLGKRKDNQSRKLSRYKTKNRPWECEWHQIPRSPNGPSLSQFVNLDTTLPTACESIWWQEACHLFAIPLSFSRFIKCLGWWRSGRSKLRKRVVGCIQQHQQQQSAQLGLAHQMVGRIIANRRFLRSSQRLS